MRRPRTRALCAGVAAAWVLCVLAGAAGAQPVTTSEDDVVAPPPGSLREAIENASPNGTITFAIEPPATITLEGDLGPLQDGMTIDGTGASNPVVTGATFLILDLDDLNPVNATVIDLNTGPGVIQLGDGDVLTFTANNDFAVAANVSDTVSTIDGGSLVKNGDATLTLAGLSAFRGDLTIEAGTLVGSTLSLPEIITNDGALVFNESVDALYFGVVGGTGTVEKTGTGTLIFLDNQTYQGVTTISEGTLGVHAGTLQGDIVNNADLIFGQLALVGAGTFDGNITGSGSLTKQGPEDLTLTGANSWSGNTNVLEGRLIGTTSSISGQTVNLAVGTTELVLQQDGDGVFGGRITGLGALVKDGTGSVQLTGNHDYVGGTSVLAGSLVVTTGSLPGDTSVAMDALLVFDQASDGSFGGAISGAGAVEKRSGGTLTVTGAHTFMGGTTINGGALGLDGSLASAVLVGAAGTLGGTGSVNGLVTVNGALSPGLGGQGTFDVNDVDFEAGSSFVVDVNDDGTGDLLTTNDVEFKAGSALEVKPTPGSYDDVKINVLLSAMPIGGVIPDPADTVFLMIDTAEPVLGTLEVTVDGVVDDLEEIGRTRNQKAVGAALDRFTGANPELSDPGIDELFANMALLETEAQVQAALDDLSGEAISAFTTARQALAERMQRTLHRRMRSVLFESDEAWPTAGRGRSTTRRAAARRDVAAVPLGERGMRGWLDGYAVLGDLDGDSNAADVDYDLYGASGGFDILLGDQVLAGLSAGYARTEVDVGDRHSDGDADTAQGALYAAYATPLVYAGVSGRYAWSNANSKRRIEIGTLSAHARGDFDSHDFGVRGEVAVNAYETRGVRFQPLAAFDWSHLGRESFDESGAGSLGLDIDSEDLDSTLLQLGGRIDAVFPVDEEAVIAPELRAFWLHEFGDRDREVEAAIAGAPFTVVGAEVKRDSGLFGIGWSMSLGANVRASADYDIRLDSDRTEHVGGVTIDVRF
jgi:autotransporter-associated beta strand protein